MNDDTEGRRRSSTAPRVPPRGAAARGRSANERGGERLFLASSRPGPVVRPVLVIRLDVDNHGTARLPRESRGGDPLPAGTHCRIDLGTARRYFSLWDELSALVQRCASVEVAGADPEAVEAVCRELNTVASAGTRRA